MEKLEINKGEDGISRVKYKPEVKPFKTQMDNFTSSSTFFELVQMIHKDSAYINSKIFSSCFNNPIISGFLPIHSLSTLIFCLALLARLWHSAVLKQIIPPPKLD